CLDLDRKIVGVKFIRSEEEYRNLQVRQTLKPINYCGMVKAATKGHALKANEDLIRCKSGLRTLGINPVDEKNSQGENWVRLGIYKDKELSKEVRENLLYNQEKIYGVLVQPLENFYIEKTEHTTNEDDRNLEIQKIKDTENNRKLSEVELNIKNIEPNKKEKNEELQMKNNFRNNPEIVIMVTKPYNIMRITQGYSYHFGMPKEINFIGNQAICLECTARPYVVDDMNISMLCIGTRHRSGWKDEEMAVGIPYSKFEKVVEGIFETVNIMENNKNKKNIAEKFKEYGYEFEIELNSNYYDKV
ncbi:MAG: DUF169 domain-containing protein, partial [Clostridioides sp.]|nr:DUF169 domain-containing protein [Clostridioides sp.]